MNSKKGASKQKSLQLMCVDLASHWRSAAKLQQHLSQQMLLQAPSAALHSLPARIAHIVRPAQTCAHLFKQLPGEAQPSPGHPRHKRSSADVLCIRERLSQAPGIPGTKE